MAVGKFAWLGGGHDEDWQQGYTTLGIFKSLIEDPLFPAAD